MATLDVESPLKVVLDTDLWLHDEDGVTHASAPWITNHKTGEGMPGLVKSQLRVVRRGTEIEITVVKMVSDVPSSS